MQTESLFFILHALCWKCCKRRACVCCALCVVAFTLRATWHMRATTDVRYMAYVKIPRPDVGYSRPTYPEPSPMPCEMHPMYETVTTLGGFHQLVRGGG